MLQCSIKKWTKTSKGLAMPGPKLVSLPDEEARRLEAKGDVEVIEPAPAPVTEERVMQKQMDRRMRKDMTREAKGA